MPKPVPSPSPADSQIITPDNDLAVDFFFEENKGKILAIIVVALLGLGGWIFYNYTNNQRLAAESTAFYTAKTSDDLKALIARYPTSVVAGNAQLLLAQKLRDAGKIDEALALLADFTKTASTHPLIAQGWLSYAGTLELKGDTAKALQALTTVSTQYSTTEAAPAALSAQARLTKKSGDLKKAREIYENIVQRFPSSYWSQDAQQEIGKLPE